MYKIRVAHRHKKIPKHFREPIWYRFSAIEIGQVDQDLAYSIYSASGDAKAYPSDSEIPVLLDQVVGELYLLGLFGRHGDHVFRHALPH